MPCQQHAETFTFSLTHSQSITHTHTHTHTHNTHTDTHTDVTQAHIYHTDAHHHTHLQTSLVSSRLCGPSHIVVPIGTHRKDLLKRSATLISLPKFFYILTTKTYLSMGYDKHNLLAEKPAPESLPSLVEKGGSKISLSIESCSTYTESDNTVCCSSQLA